MLTAMTTGCSSYGSVGSTAPLSKSMEFWGVEFKAGQQLKVSSGEGKVINLSQASIGESKKGKDESVLVYVKVGEQKLVIGTLSAYKHPQIQYDVVFKKDFELSHNWKNGSIFGYRTQNPGDDEGFSGDEFDSDSEDEELPIKNGKPELVHVAAAKPATADKAKVSVQEAAKEAKADSDEDSSDDGDLSDSDDEDLSDDSDEKMGEGDSDDEEDGSEEDEKTPTPEKNKKRPTEPENKTLVSSKKVKIGTPQKTDGKIPKSENPKTPATAGKSIITCGSCSKTFNSDKGQGSRVSLQG
uniref:Nucleoplasmin-like domain-containing protein n=1 Tax=Kalanchoe fedtschenkoi TaxID=63787 RepID=A0A7N0UHB8_KALFE